MGHIVGYEDIPAQASYSILFRLEGESFRMEGVGPKTAVDALKIARALLKKRITPEVRRIVYFGNTKSGYSSTNVPDIPPEDLTIERLEQIISEGENLPIHRQPIVRSSYRT